MPSKSTAISKAQLKNIIKISIGDKKTRKRRRRKNTTSTKKQKQADPQMDLLVSLASKPPMRAVVQPTSEPQNQLIQNSILATNAQIVKALNDLNTPSYSTGFSPPTFPEAPTQLPPQTSTNPPATPAT